MTQDNARTAANVVLGIAGIAAAYVVLTTPSLRRLVLRAARVWVGAALPAYLVAETRQAWMQSAR